MQSHVYADAGLTKHAGRFVWLSIDTEQAKSADFLERMPVEAWPTLFVVEPVSGTVAFKWLGSATVAQLEKILDDGELAARMVAKPKGPLGSPEADTLLAQADLKYAAAKQADAAGLYQAALEKGGAAWPRRAQAVERLVNALTETGQLEPCARAALAQAPSLPRGPSFANTVGAGLSCAMAAEGQPFRVELLPALEKLAQEAVGLENILADDRSSIYEELVDCRAAADDAAGAKKVASAWLSFLEGEAGKAQTPEARAAFEAHRVLAAIKLGEPARAVPALEQSERDLPADYNVPARLAQLYLELGRLDDALEASRRALAKVYGPRRLRLLESRAAIFLKKGDNESAKRTLKEALAFAKTLPAVQVQARQVERIETQLKELP
jgi:tetratricopeptide (TPR) repeat protein